MKTKGLLCFGAVALCSIVLAGCGSNQLTSASNSSQKAQVSKTPESISKMSVSSSTSLPLGSQEGTKTAPKLSKSVSTTSSVSFDSLNHAQQINTLLAWVQNSEGLYEVYDKDQNNIIVINMGPNGTNGSHDMTKMVNNSAKISKSGNTYSLLVIQNPNTMSQDPFASSTWIAKSSISESELMNQYFSNSQKVVSQLYAEHAGKVDPAS